jgi:hypothetical protein
MQNNHYYGHNSTHYHCWNNQEQFDRIETNLLLIIKNQTNMGQELDALTAAVASNTTVEQSAIVLINGLKQKLDNAIASGNPAALVALSAELGTSDAALAAAITANTPAVPVAATAPAAPVADPAAPAV